ncbi:Short-chain dehydrogenase/reductase SDR [Neofusicoccum parvum]|uniref:Short-chain dehydrogenase/reductase SDR n=2 Tax=Neofusicoccum parvum TaxID=310453 RepID=A0ACB5SQ76_9PEZI|nr:putative 3-hydroxyacyl- dehydrogenase type-2 protein [Neofusicoccum parvum UCRNP2]GME36270.1 Short-chain dehydrogenase/reductase SDR [Neofusicoccum parvum]GME52798.1 Short-chain dehydrogenase/reductase SDR [Neofusicoccum parvum]
MQIPNRLFIISGGASGLGLATVKLLHSQGAYVAILDMNSSSGEELVKELGGERARFFETDVTDTENIAAAVKGSVEFAKEKGVPLGGVLAGAGIINHKNEPFPIDSFDMVLSINLRGTVDLIRQVLPHLTQNEPYGPDNERGVVIMVASAAAFDGQMGQVAYAASKGAVRSMTLPMARDLSRFGIRVVTLAPSLFESNMTAMMSDKVRKSLERVMEFPKRAGKPEEFARTVKDAVENSMLNGEVIRLDGAMRMPSKL